MKNSNTFLFFGYLLQEYDKSIIQIIENNFPDEIRNNPNVINHMKDYYDNLEKESERYKTLALHNLFIEIVNIFKCIFN